MRIPKIIILTVVACLLPALSSEAAARGDNGPRVRVKLGVSALGGYPMMSVYAEGCTADFSPKYTFGGALDFDVRFGKRFTLGTDVVFKYTKIGITDSKHKFESTIGAFTIQLPIRAVLHFGMFRIYAGPVVTLMDDPSYEVKGEKTLFGRIYPTLTYTAGAGVRLGSHLDIVAYYDGAFNTTTNYYAYNTDPTASREISTQLSHVMLSVRFMF